ncbi:MAG: IS1182 family transposase [Proteobacteria bacterium]|nr:IS1182 family transposase [Actinomycetes bacterium]MCP4919707.1 IS1182 family transposase [Pseudomonadota bacterium]
MIYWAMAKTYREWEPDQQFLLPPSPHDWLSRDHLAYFILDIVARLDLSDIERVIQARDPRGGKPYHPRMMVALLLYSYSVGLVSSRKIERATYENIAFRVLTGGQHPDHDTIADFRKTHLSSFKALFLQVAIICRELGLAKLGVVALDGTKIKASASKHKAMSYDRMRAEKARLEGEIADLLKQAEEADSGDAALTAGSLPEELKRRQSRLDKIDEAMEALEAAARKARRLKLREQAEGQEAKAADDDVAPRERKSAATRAKTARAKADALRDEDNGVGDDDDDDGGPRMPVHQPRHMADGTPHDRAQRNFTDPESRIMEHQGGFVQGYNCQALTDGEHGVIVGVGVSNHAADTHHLPPMVEGMVDTVGAPEKLLADAGYWAPCNAEICEKAEIDAYIAVGRETYQPAPSGSVLGPDASPRERMLDKVRTKAGRRIYALRKHVGETPFGLIKAVQGFRRFSMRGIAAADGEWSLVCTAHNILKLWRHGPSIA